MYVNYPEEHLEDFLCYNAHIGWVTKCENNTYRIAIFADDQKDAKDILDKIRKDLNCELEYDFHNLQYSYAIGEKKLFASKGDAADFSANTKKYNSNEDDSVEQVKLTQDEFYVLKQIESLRKPLKENVDKKILLKSCSNVNKTIESLLQKNIIEQLLIRMDTRLLGYEWYTIFVQIDESRIDEFIKYLKDNFNNITHINALISSTSKWNLDFEAHVLSYIDINILIEKIQAEFNKAVRIEKTLRIIRECKFSFMTHFVSDSIFNKFLLKNVREQNRFENNIY